MKKTNPENQNQKNNMALFTLYYERNHIDECGTEIQKRKMVLDQLMQKIENEIRFEMFKTPDGKRYKANVTVMNDAVCNRVMNVLHQLEKIVDYPEKRMISEVMSLIVGIPFDSIGGDIKPFANDIMMEVKKEIDKGIDETFVNTSPIKVEPDYEKLFPEGIKIEHLSLPHEHRIELRKKQLHEMFELLPTNVEYQDGTISFGLNKEFNESKNETFYECHAYFTDVEHDEDIPTMDDESDDSLSFVASDAGDAIAMMIGHLKYYKII